jgi:serine aminopeptidase S33 family
MPRENVSVHRPMEAKASAMDGWLSTGDGPAERVDPETGGREIVEFLGTGEQRMFGIRHRPVSVPAMGVVICPGLQAEFFRNYRREVLLARGLAASGFCVQRFHYRGTGQSDGESSEATLWNMVDDAVLSAEWMRSQEGCEQIAFVGVRLGGLVAAAAADRLGTAPLVLWEPFTDATVYFRDIFRAGRIHELQKGVTTAPSMETQLEELRQLGRLDVLGYSIDLALYESVKDCRLVDVLGDHVRPVLLVGSSPKGIPKNEYARLASHWQSSGLGVETHMITMPEEPWWFVGGMTVDEEIKFANEMTRVIAEWIGRTSLHQGDIQ